MTEPFSMTADYDRLNAQTPASHTRPLIGITGNYSDSELRLLPGYFRSIEAAGGVAVVIPPRDHCDEATLSLLEQLDGLLLSGGADLNPLFVGEDPVEALHGINPIRDRFELGLIRLAYDRQVPMLGICRGIQMLAAALGGTLVQDIATAMPGKTLVKHSQDAPRPTATHFVTTEDGSLVQKLLGKRFAVNSFHHQAVGEPGERFRVTARSADGVVEAMESTEFKSIMGIQWHPECFILGGDESMMPLFRHFVGEADSFRRAKNLHRHIVTLDSHCDTPMFFDKGVELTRRDPQLLVDFHKMKEGHLDASVMVAYIPQGERTPEGHAAATEQALRTLREIEERVGASRCAALARTPDDIVRNKRNGLLSIVRGIENGYALGTDLANVKRFADMGVVYITLCHNGDNEICDSARRSTASHGGLSDFGRKVVREMNRRGVMVDLSHAAETSFYDAFETSVFPIFCSHASSRALCNHPRNLTDDQLRTIAASGGVAQVTLYHGFLLLDEEQRPANVTDAVAHLMHMIDVAGIDHVGIGTDFDGDGGICGCANASELINFTRRLMAEGLTDDDLKKVWGGNFMRVMHNVQSVTEPERIPDWEPIP